MYIAQSNYHLAWRLRARFAGNRPPREYISRDVRHADPGWGGEVFARPIRRLEFFLPTGHVIVLAGMRRYNFFAEAVQNLSGGRTHVAACWLCGHLPDRDLVEMWRITKGKIIRQRKPFGREWGGTAIRGWKAGAVGAAVESRIREAA